MLTWCVLLTVAAVWCLPGRRARRELLVTTFVDDVGRPWSMPRGPRPSAAALWRRVRGEPSGRADRLIVELLGGIAAGLAAGLSPGAAVTAAREAVESRLHEFPELDLWLARLTQVASDGGPVGATWVAMGRDLDLPLVTRIGRAWALSEVLGCPLTEAVRSTVAAHEAATRLERAFAAQSAGPRATVHLLTALPALGLALMPILGVDLARAFSPPVLLLAVAPGAGLILAGRLLTRRMVDRALRSPAVT